MKKLLGVILAVCFAFIPMITNAAETINLEDYETLNFKEALAQEKIELKYDKYAETDDQVTIYLFRGNGCHYCQSFLNFLNSIAEEYGKYFKVVSFETWYDKANTALLESVSEFMESPAQGVPYIIIGDQVFPGYAEDYDEAIKSTIKTLYDSKDTYDVFEEYNKYLVDLERAENAEKYRVIYWNAGIIAIATIVIIFYINYSNKRLVYQLTNPTEETVVAEEKVAVHKTNSTVKKPVKKVTKKVSKE